MSGGLPTGVVTFLFSDVEGSTKLLRELGDGYVDALHTHRRVLRDAFRAHDGVEVDTQGDAFFVAFGRASDAVAAASEAQRALATGPIKVRMGLHTGEPRLTEQGYVGLDVHRGARIAAVGHGGQVLMSQATRALVEVDARDLGPHRLKDLTAPERIYQLEIEGLGADFPRLKTLEAGMPNLPAQRTSFVGREEELRAIDRMLEQPDCRLVTLVGPGGTGKSRLALEAAARRIEHYPHGVHYVPLAGVPAPDLFAPAVAESLQFQVDSAHSAIAARDQLIDYLRERTALLVLDNFEHLLDARDVVSQIIEEAPTVEMLTTSRERLQVQSEWVLDVEGLEFTNGNGHASGNGQAHDSAASRLFVDRARQVNAAFVPGDAERPQVERVCRLVHGMPLAIELAAAWVSTLSCAEIADEIEHNLGFLQTSMRDVPERHRSLRAAFDQSWRLLSEDARRSFARLSVFRGGFTREAAVAVAEANITQLHDLLTKSLVRRTEIGRFELHELLRQYAAERLAETPDELANTSERHARHYLGRLAERRETLAGPNLAEARDELRRDLDNLRLATEWAIGNWPDGEVRAILRDLHLFFFVHGTFEGAETFDRLAETTGTKVGGWAEPALAADVTLAVLTHRAALRTELGYDEEAQRFLLACVPILRERDLRAELGSALCTLGIIATYLDVYPDAARFLEEAIDLLGKAHDPFFAGEALCWLGFVQLLVNDLAGTRKSFEQAHEIGRELGGPLLLAYALSKLGILADAEGRYAEAMRLHMEANALFESVGDVGGTGYTLSRASLSAYGLGDFAAAMRLGRAGYEAFRQVNHRWGMISGLCRMGFAEMAVGTTAESREHFFDALGRARESKAISLQLLALSGIGALLAKQGDSERAALLLTFALGHEQLPAAYGFAARPALDALEATLPPEELAEVRKAAAAASLDELVSDVIG